MKIAIIGLGLIGGSLGLALKAAQNPGFKVVGIPRREETIAEALKLGAIDEGTTDLKKGVEGAAVIFICTPINRIIPILTEISPLLSPATIVTDVGSTKQEIVAAAEKIVPKGISFIGGHPLAGKETTKLEAAEAGLFRGKKWVLTRTSRTSPRGRVKLTEIISLTGAEILELEPKKHDLVLAAVSHLPLVVAVALVNAVAGEEEAELMARCAASGFRDTTRIASGDPVLGVDMFSTNKKALLKMIKAFKKTTKELEGLILSGQKEALRQKLEEARKFRQSIY